MRIGMMVAVLALASCGENQGWNPNYQFGATPYGEYRTARERALVTGADVGATIPVALPVQSPSAADLAVKARVAPSARPTVQRRVTTARPNAPVSIVPDVMLPTSASGLYAGTTPVLTRYALQTTHIPGTRVHTRSGGSDAQAARLCAQFPSADRAQLAFLAAGGPARDPRGLDPDGDGFVCGWTPVPLRQSHL